MKLTNLDLKQALQHEQFRSLFPELQSEIKQFVEKPTCPCNIGLFHKLYQYYDRLKKYFPNKEIDNKDKWEVINCHVDDLEKHLHKPGQKQIAVARYKDQVTILINYLNYY